MRRILVIGSGGSGKTRLAREIAARTGLPLIHLDSLYWRAGWEPTPNPEWDRIIERLVAGPAWVIDGNYSRTLPTRLAACDTVVFLDLARWRCLWRLFRRRLQYFGQSRPDLPPGCGERLTWEFVRWVWTYRAERRPAILRQLAELATSKRVVVLSTPGEVVRFLSKVDAQLDDGVLRNRIMVTRDGSG